MLLFLPGWYFSAMDNVFLAIYIMELILKLYALGSHFFNSGWNVMGKLAMDSRLELELYVLGVF